MTWNDYKPQLFENMEQRRARQPMFRVEQIYSFIIGCSKQFNTAKKAEAEQASNRIKDEGTFLLAADSFCEFLAMFPAETQPQQPEPAAGQAAPAARSQAPADARRGAGQPFQR